PHVEGDVVLGNPTGPGWADPETGSLDDNRRVVGRDGRSYGPLPRSWGCYRGLYHYGDRVVVSYTVGTTEVLESPGAILPEGAGAEASVFTRTLQLGPRDKNLQVVVATGDSDDPTAKIAGNVVRFTTDEPLLVGYSPNVTGASWATVGKHLCLKI